MRKLTPLLVFILCLGLAFEGSAQMSKKEQKEWKKRIKNLTPQQYKTLLDDNKSLKSQNASLKSELAGIDDTAAEKDEQISNFQSQVDGLKRELENARAAVAKAQKAASEQRSSGPSVGASINDQEGVVFKVQIGAFKNKDLSKFLEAGDNFSGEVDENGLKRYSLGVFRDYWEADTFKKYLRENGRERGMDCFFQGRSKSPHQRSVRKRFKILRIKQHYRKTLAISRGFLFD